MENLNFHRVNYKLNYKLICEFGEKGCADFQFK